MVLPVVKIKSKDTTTTFRFRWVHMQSRMIVAGGHRLNMDLDLQTLFGLLCTAVLIGWEPAFGLIYEGTSPCNQGCWWNERSLNRGLNRGRGWGIDKAFFGIHVRTSKSTRTFKFRTNSVSVSPRSFLKRSRSSSIAIEANTHPAHQPTPQRILIWCVSQGYMHF